jgi:hypothetical protein
MERIAYGPFVETIGSREEVEAAVRASIARREAEGWELVEMVEVGIGRADPRLSPVEADVPPPDQASFRVRLVRRGDRYAFTSYRFWTSPGARQRALDAPMPDFLGAS